MDRFLSQTHSLYDLPRSFYVEGDSDGSLTNYLDAFFQAPNISCFRRLNLCWFGCGPSPEQLEDWFTPDRDLISLALCFGTLSDGHAQALPRCRGLHSLHELNLGGHILSQQGMQALSQAPTLSGLRRFLIGEAPGEVRWSSREERCGELHFSQADENGGTPTPNGSQRLANLNLCIGVPVEDGDRRFGRCVKEPSFHRDCHLIGQSATRLHAAHRHPISVHKGPGHNARGRHIIHPQASPDKEVVVERGERLHARGPAVLGNQSHIRTSNEGVQTEFATANLGNKGFRPMFRGVMPRHRLML